MNRYLKMGLNVLLYVGIIYLLVLALNVGITWVLKSSAISEDTYNRLYDNQMIIVALLYVLSIPLYIVVFKLQKRKFSEYCNLTAINTGKTVNLLVVGLGMGIFSTSFLALSVVQQKIPVLGDTYNFYMGGGTIVSSIIGSVLVVPAVEEVIFRGLIFNELKKNMNLAVALVLQAIIFSLVQPNFPAAVFGFAGSLLFALGYVWVKSLWAPILLQVGSSFFMFLFNRTGVCKWLTGLNDIFAISFLIVGAAIIVLSMMILRKSTMEGQRKVGSESISL